MSRSFDDPVKTSRSHTAFWFTAWAGSPQRPSLLNNRQFTLLWVGQAVSSLGDIMFVTTLTIWVAVGLARGQAWAPLAVAATFSAAALPSVIVGPLAGVFVDRWDRRLLMMRVDAVRALLIAILALPTGILSLEFLSVGRPSVSVALGSIYLVTILTAAGSNFFGPARMAAIRDVVSEPDRPQGSSLTQASTSLTVIVGPPLAAVLYFSAGAGPALAIDSLSFVVSYLAVRALRLPQVRAAGIVAAPRHFHLELAEGLRYFRQSRVLTTVLVANGLTMLGVGALNALDIFFLTHNLHAPAHLYGTLSALYGGGVLVGAVAAGRWTRRLGPARAFWLSMAGLGALTLLYARLEAFGPAVPIFVLVGVLNAAVNVAAMPLILNATPREFVGRVFAVFGPVTTLASLISMAGAGYLAGAPLHNFHAGWLGLHWGPIDTLFTASGLFILIGGVYARARLRLDP